MTQTLVLNIVVIGLLVTLFASINHMRSSVRLRLWMAGWICVLAHFGALLWQPAGERLAELADAVSTSALMLCGISFLLSSAVLTTQRSRIYTGLALALPALTFCWLSSFRVAAPMLDLSVDLAGNGVGLGLLWYLYRDRLRVAIPGTAVVVVCSHWTLFQIIRGSPEMGVYLILMEIFAMYALLFWQDHPGRSAGVLTTVAGLLCWAAVFPVALALFARFPAVQIDPEAWNLPKFFVAFGMIVTLLEEEKAQARRQCAQYQLLFERNPLPMWICAGDGDQMLEVNEAATVEYGYRREEFLAMSMPRLLSGSDRSAAGLSGWPVLGAHRGRGPWQLLKQDGGRSLVETSAQEILFEGRPAQLVLAVDVTERTRMHEQLMHQANHDPLTGLPNRLLLEDRLNAALAAASRHGTKAAILCLDLDRFKQINDTFGHSVGDASLREVATRLKQRLRTVDTAARIGGEEFMVILDQIRTMSDAEKVAEDLLFAIGAPCAIDGHRVQLSASLGIAIYPDDGSEAADLWRMSDAAMYRAKQAGGNRYRLFCRMAGWGAEPTRIESAG